MDILQLANGKFVVRRLTCRLFWTPKVEYLYVSSYSLTENWITDKDSEYMCPRVQVDSLEEAQKRITVIERKEKYYSEAVDRIKEDRRIAKTVIAVHTVQYVKMTLCERINAVLARLLPWKR
jgi:hypothetical protein